MSLTRFRYFEKVARYGSIREASERLHVATSAISRQIAQLEEEFSVSLFERQTRGMKLTAAGEILFEHARAILSHRDQARSGIDDLLGLRRGHVKVWSIEGMIKDFVSPTLALFHQKYPAVTADVVVASSDEVLAALLEDDADIGITFDPPRNSRITVAAQFPAPLLAVMSPGHVAATHQLLTLPDLTRWPIALPDSSFGIRHVVDAAARASDVEFRPSVVSNSIEALRGFARAGSGTTILTQASVEEDIERGMLTTIPISEFLIRAPAVKICRSKDRELSNAGLELAAILKQQAARYQRS